MATVLKNVLAFTGLAIGVPASIAHGLNINGLGLTPDLVLPADTSGYTVTANATNVTVTRGVSGAAAVNVYVERWHSFECALPLPGQLSGLIPFIHSGNGSGGASGNPQRFRYTAVGGETSTIVITLPAVRASINYNVQATFGGVNAASNILTPMCPPSLYLTNQFTLVLTAPPAIGDVIMFTVEDLS